MRRRRAYMAAFMTGVLFVAGIAFAEWLATGSGSGNAQAGVAESLVVSGGTPTALLYPGTSGDVALSISNPNPYPVTVVSIVGDGTITADATHTTAGCTTDLHAVTFADQSGAWVVPADDDLAVVLAGAASMGGGSADACQGATFTIPLAVSGNSGGEPSTTTGGETGGTDGTPVACTDDSFEDNDASATATLLQAMSPGTTRNYNLQACTGDADFLRFTALDGGSCTFTNDDYRMNVRVTAGAGAGALTVQIRLNGTLVQNVPVVGGATSDFQMVLDGNCGFQDTWPFEVMVIDPNLDRSYTLFLSHVPI